MSDSATPTTASPGPAQPLPPPCALSPVEILAYLLNDHGRVRRILGDAAEMPEPTLGAGNANAIWRLLATARISVPLNPMPAQLAALLQLTGWQLVSRAELPRAGDIAVCGEDERVLGLTLVAKGPAGPRDRFKVVDNFGPRLCSDLSDVLYWLRLDGT